MQQADYSSATVFVPGHITGFFSAQTAATCAQAGSRGAGIALTDGVEVTVTPGSGLQLNGEEIEMLPVGDVCTRLGVDAAVDATTSLPLGAGFGVSGALALGTALAANAVFDCGKSENELITMAHCAEVEAGTGLGDVVAQARGGLPIRIDPGSPSHGRVDGVAARPRIEYISFGEVSTETVLAGDTDDLTRAGESALSHLLERPTLSRFMTASREFADDAGLVTEEVATAIDAVAKADGDSGDDIDSSAAMAMLGNTVFATGTGLSAAGYDAQQCRVDAGGARLCDS
ncbi:pantoate kinase [Halonotius pteroides]|uniref:Pantoate kinase n=1 Tax=Halonotius pteroides TaxID=268735 RepID=A0A3A6Q433_9EURY|nr:pantoate kinase [Halonotius pteroides]RJX50831.1 sugar kinase [Halonotius pteroides]